MKRKIALIAATAIALGTVAVADGWQARGGHGEGYGHMMERGEGPGGVGRGPMGQMPDFAELDANGDGKLTVDDFAARRAARMAAIDTDGDGAITAEEFAAHAAEQASARAAEMFARLDADGDGVLSADAFAMMNRGPGPERMLDRADTDGDGAVSEAEFDAALERMASMSERGFGMGERRGGRHGHN